MQAVRLAAPSPRGAAQAASPRTAAGGGRAWLWLGSIVLLAATACSAASSPRPSSSAAHPPPTASAAPGVLAGLKAPRPLRVQLQAQRAGAAAAVQRWLTEHPDGKDKAFIDDAVALLGPPPGPAVQAREIAYLRALKSSRTAQGIAAAHDLDLHGETDVWDQYAQSGPDPARLHAQLAQLQGLLRRATRRAKEFYARPGPRVLAPDLAPGRADSAKVSYPSSHAAYAYAQAALLSAAEPARAGAFYDTASTIAFSRLYVAGHYPSDVVAGARLGFLLEALQTRRP